MAQRNTGTIFFISISRFEFWAAFAGEFAAAANAYYKSVQLGNHTDWQALVELCCDYPNLKLS